MSDRSYRKVENDFGTGWFLREAPDWEYGFFLSKATDEDREIYFSPEGSPEEANWLIQEYQGGEIVHGSLYSTKKSALGVLRLLKKDFSDEYSVVY